MPGSGKLVKGLVEKNLITDDPQLKTFLLETIDDSAASKKPAVKMNDQPKPPRRKRKVQQ